jgi:ABC-type phosphate/phosphonate transport system ATPase subunit
LLGHVFQGAEAQSCKIAYEVGGVAKELVWQPALGQQAELSGLEIYDTECGQVYVTLENEVAFEPWLLGIFQQLIDACGHIDAILAKEMAALVSTKPVMPAEYAGTAAAVWYAALKATTSTHDVATWTNWLPAQQDELAGLQARLLEKNPADQAKSLRIRAAAILKFTTDWQTIATALSAEAVDALLVAKADTAAKRKAASEDAAKVFAAAPLAGVGLESWKLLWEQARAYSEKHAYPEQVFPVVGADAHCVLCQQSLDDVAGKRLDGFERFVKGELETLAQASEKKLSALIEALPTVPSADDLNVRQATLGLDEKNVVDKLTAFRDGLASRCSALPGATRIEDVPALPDPALLGDLPVLALALEKQAKAFEEDAAKTDKTALKKTVREAEARKWIGEQKVAVAAEVSRLQKVSALDSARKLTNTTALSTKKSELAQQLVSDAFILRFNAEMKALGAARINVVLVQTRTAKGHVYHQIQLKGAKLKASTAEVLSEGERRIVSLAAFLADVEGIEANTPFVFDDPISSLDQDYEEAVVTRLAALAKKRQVIVFTHRLSLLTMLEDAVDSAGLKACVVAVNREPWGTGQPGETPFPARKPKQAINGLTDAVTRARKVLNDAGRAPYEIHAKAICRDVRILTERIVEDILLGGVVLRFRRSVQTGQIVQLGKIQIADCKFIEAMMTKYSRFEHSQSAEAPVALPEPDEIAADLAALQAWLKDFTDRKAPAGA